MAWALLYSAAKFNKSKPGPTRAARTGWVIDPGDRLMNWLLDKTG